ncbi:MAG: TatD family hydrolase [Spirochaetia bacterium]|nr:TatD family hydrolase [Spirochaetia bacterium]
MSNATPLIDTHCHIDLILEKGLSYEQIESSLVESNINAVIQIASDPIAMEFSVKFCHEKSGKVQYFYTFGLHPNEVHELDINSGISYIKKYHEDSRFIGVGEVGLDFYYGLDHKDLQMSVFEMYLDIAQEYKKPVIIHTRNAHDETIQLIKQYSDKIPLLVHCFTGNVNQIKDYLDLGAYISFSGITTFKNAQDIKEAAIYCPVERILVETDAPFLAPVPNRGQVNRPGWVRYVADFLSEVRGVSIHNTLYENSIRFFNLRFKTN